MKAFVFALLRAVFVISAFSNSSWSQTTTFTGTGSSAPTPSLIVPSLSLASQAAPLEPVPPTADPLLVNDPAAGSGIDIECLITGPTSVCPGTTNVFSIIGDSDTNATYGWSLVNNKSGAAFLGETNGRVVVVVAGIEGDYSLQVNVDEGQHPGKDDDDFCLMKVIVNPAIVVRPLKDRTVCPGSRVVFSVAASVSGPFTFLWRKDEVPIFGANSDTLILESVAASDGGSYCVEVAGSCGTAVSCAKLMVESLPVITCPPALMFECLDDVPLPDPGSVSVTGGAGDVIVVHLGDTVSSDGCTVIITRTYGVTDACGSVSVCNQIITVRSTTPPKLVCAPDMSVECGRRWEFAPPVASAFCASSKVTILETGTQTNSLGGNLFVATRSWLAMDACSNQASCSQTVSVVDTTPPEIHCPADLTATCAGSEGVRVSFSVTATDICDTNVQLTCKPASGSVFPLGVTAVECIAIDASGNSNRCSFNVTVLDPEPPSIVCPADIAVAEDPVASGSAVVTFPLPVVIDNCDDNPAVSCTPPSGSSFPVGNNTVTCRARDAAGNTNACSFTVKVVPHSIGASSTADSGPGTLRQALLDANAAPGFNVIQFNFPGPPPHIIHLFSPLPAISDPVFIDGWSQIEFTGFPVIELDGSGAGFAGGAGAGADAGGPGDGPDGLVLTAGNTTVRGLVLNGFAVGIRVQDNGGNVIQGNFIGTDETGTIASGNSSDGILINSPNNVIGGSDADARNVISGNLGNGIHLASANASGNLIQGNFIGTGSDGTSPLGNGQDGVNFSGEAGANTVGGIDGPLGNVIAFNGFNGVSLDPTAGIGNAIRGNSISSNVRLGIDLGADGVTDNDAGDFDGGPNNRQNFPMLFSARDGGGAVTIDGTLGSASNAVYELDFFVSPTADASGFGEGATFLGSASVHTDRHGIRNFTVHFAGVNLADQFVTATATDPSGNTSEFSRAIRVGSPPEIVTQPVGTNASQGSTVTFCVTVVGSAPLTYQWRHNGANIPEATSECLTILEIGLSDGGSYTVVVANDFGVIVSDPAVLVLTLPDIPAGDNFVDRVFLEGSHGQAAGGNTSATQEPGEPEHFGKPGGKSVWYSWTAPATGIATFRTTGSTFDTLLAIYTGAAVSNLTVVAGDEDRGGFYTSQARFNAQAGTQYQIAIDGFGGVSGEFAFTWDFEPASDLLPIIHTQPQSQTVAPGSSVTFKVDACTSDGDCETPDPKKGEPLKLAYQWFFLGKLIKGATNPTLTVKHVQDGSVGEYTVQVKQGDRLVESLPASLQINTTDGFVEDVQATDKFLDTVIAPIVLHLGTPSFEPGPGPGIGADPLAAAGVTRGYTGTQVFNTTGSSTEAGEEPICGVVGGASQWISFVADETGVLYLSTDGSSYDTVMAVLVRSATNAAVLQVAACDNDSGLDGKDSALTVPVQAGKTNFIVIDGVNGATGILHLNYSLTTPTTLTSLGMTAQGAFHLRVSGRPGIRFTIQASPDLLLWSPLLTTNSASGVFDYFDTSATASNRLYRALLLP